VGAFIAKHYGGVVGHSVARPLGTVTAVDHHSLVYALLQKYYGQGGAVGMGEPLHTITSDDRFGLVTVQVAGESWCIVDIGMRMLTPEELKLAQGFPPDYILTGSKREQVAHVGRSVPPPVVAALVRANMGVAP
jgi:DNA (cytosine-5)-methyltransferase 1